MSARANELFEFVEFHKTIVENDVLLDFVLLGQPFEAQAVGFTLFAQLVRMGGPQHDINHVRKLGQNARQRVEHVLDAFVRRKQPERQQHHPPLHAELVFVIIRIHERDVGDAVGDDVNLARGGLENLLQHLPAPVGHHHQPSRARDQFPHHPGVAPSWVRAERCGAW